MNSTNQERRRFVIIANRRARFLAEVGVADEFQQQVERGFAEQGVSASVRLVEPDELEDKTRAAIKESPAAIVSAGGDGTVRTLAGMLRGQEIPLGILPCGTFNLLARDLGVPLELEAAVTALASAEPTHIDLAEVSDELFLCSCVLGYFPEKLMKQDRFRGLPWWRKVWVGARALFGTYFDFKPLKLTVEANGEEQQFRTRFVSVVNNSYSDTPGVVPHRERLDAGHLTLYVSLHRSRWGTWKAALRFLAGRIEADPDVHIINARSVALDTRRRQVACRIDGDVQQFETPITFRALPANLLVLKPSASDAA